MKKIAFIFIVFSNFTLFAQTFEDSLEVKKQIRRDSVYSNRFNKGNYQIGGVPIFILMAGNMRKYNTFGYGGHLEFGYFVRNRLALFGEHTTVYFDNKFKEDKSINSYFAYSKTHLGARYYLSPKRFTFFGQAFLSYAYNSEDQKAVDGFDPISFSNLNVTAGLGITFSWNVLDISLEMGYSLPFYYSKEVEPQRITYKSSKGMVGTASIFLTF